MGQFARKERMMIRSLFALSLFVAAPAFAQSSEPLPTAGQEVPEAGLAGSGQSLFSGEISLLSDYRFRGISRSDEDPALQAAVTLFPADGLYAGVRATSLKGTDSFRALDPAFRDLGDVQLDLYAGYGAQLGGGFDVDGGLVYYVFAGGDGATDYAEPYASLSYLIGPVSATAGAKYAPEQEAIGDEDMLYLFGQVDVSIPFRPWSFSAHLGHQDWGVRGCGPLTSPTPCLPGAAGEPRGAYWTWSLGVKHQLQLAAMDGVEVGLRYVDTSLPSRSGQDAGLVASLGFRF
jgi:uncharacterized protein (TIGR02001 family)